MEKVYTEHLERIEKLKKSEKEILGDIYIILVYLAMALIILFIILRINNPIATIIISVILVIIYTLVLIYLIGLAVAFGTIRAKRVFLKTEIKEEGEQEE